MTIQSIERASELQAAYDGSYYAISGAGGDLADWVNGYEGMLAEQGIGKPKQWYSTTGSLINDFAMASGATPSSQQMFPHDVTVLLFPLEGLVPTKLPMFKIQMQDRWFDDIIDNMRRSGSMAGVR